MGSPTCSLQVYQVPAGRCGVLPAGGGAGHCGRGDDCRFVPPDPPHSAFQALAMAGASAFGGRWRREYPPGGSRQGGSRPPMNPRGDARHWRAGGEKAGDAVLRAPSALPSLAFGAAGDRRGRVRLAASGAGSILPAKADRGALPPYEPPGDWPGGVLAGPDVSFEGVEEVGVGGGWRLTGRGMFINLWAG